MFGSIVMGVPREHFEAILKHKKTEVGVTHDTHLDAKAFQRVGREFQGPGQRRNQKEFPDDPLEQLRMAINAVFSSWFGARAITYRRLYSIPDSWGTALNVVAMVFGNMGETSGTGVAFTRESSPGDRAFFGECLMNAQGEDVVAGIRTPLPVSAMAKNVPEAYKELEQHGALNALPHVAGLGRLEASLAGRGRARAGRRHEGHRRVLRRDGGRPRLGRAFGEADFSGDGRVVIVSDGLWERQFKRSPEALGAAVLLDGIAYTLVGVMPASFKTIGNSDVWVPWTCPPQERAERRFHMVGVMARLQAGRHRRRRRARVAGAVSAAGRRPSRHDGPLDRARHPAA